MKHILIASLSCAAALTAQRISEVEPNDSPAGAQAISFGTHVDANLVAGTQDWYTFTVTAPSEVHIQTSGNFAVNPSVDTAVLLYDATGTTRLAWNNNQRGSMSDCGVTLQPGTYTCLVMGFTGTIAGDYGLDLIAYPAAVVGHVEGAEPNGDPGLGEVPTPITLGGTFTGSLSAPTDEDWFSFTLTQRSIVQAVVCDDGGVPQLDSTNISLRQETSPGVWAAIGGASQSNVSHRALTLSHATTLAAGNYALRITSGNAVSGPVPLDYVKVGAYGVRTQLIEMPGTFTVAEAVEPNNTPATAAYLNLGDNATGFISGSNEGDWYGVVITAPTTVGLMSDVGTPSPITDTTVRIWDATGTTTLATGSTGGPNSHGRVIFTLNQPGLYFIEVAGGLFASTGDYVLYTGGAAPMTIPASFSQQPPSTSACLGSNALRPALNRASAEVPQIGSNFVMRINNGLANTPLLTGLGFSNTMSNAVPLPLDLTVIGAPTCFLRVDPAITNFAFTDAGGFYFWDLPIPLDNVFRGVSVYAQAMLSDPTNNAAGLSMTNEVRMVLGDRGY